MKLDISLVRGIDTDLGRQAIVVAMRHFAQATGCELIAEGVEREAEARCLASLGADYGQGYWYGRPVPVAACSADGTSLPTAGARARPADRHGAHSVDRASDRPGSTPTGSTHRSPVSAAPG